MRLGQHDTREAVIALGTQDGIAWLEENIESPVGPEWGHLLYALNPDWAQLDRWIHLSKPHCLAAIDALLRFAPNPHVKGDKKTELPSGADATLVNDSISYALDHHRNPRLEKAAERIRHTWPTGQSPRHAVQIPNPLKQFASALLSNDSTLINDWSESIATAMNPPETAHAILLSLLNFADHRDIVAVVDWRESPENTIQKLRHLKSATGLPIIWQAFADHDGSNEDLLRTIGIEIKGSGRCLVSLDTAPDSYALTFVAPDAIPELESLIASALDDPLSIQRFE